MNATPDLDRILKRNDVTARELRVYADMCREKAQACDRAANALKPRKKIRVNLNSNSD